MSEELAQQILEKLASIDLGQKLIFILVLGIEILCCVLVYESIKRG